MIATYNEDLNDLLLQNQNLIYSLIKKYDYNIREDLFQVGVVGMINAYNNYDPNRNTKFSTWAYPYILGEIKKYVRENRSLKVGRDIIYLCGRIERAKELLSQRLKREPSTLEISSFLEIDECKVIEALEFNYSVKSIDEPINYEGKELTLKDIISNEENYDINDFIWLRDELCKISHHEKEMVKKRYYEGKTQQETANDMNISQVEVSRMEKKLILNLKQKAN